MGYPQPQFSANFEIHHQVVPVVEWKIYLDVIWTFNIPTRIITIIVGFFCPWWIFTATFASFSSSWSSLTLCNSNKKWLLSIINHPALEQGVYPCLHYTIFSTNLRAFWRFAQSHKSCTHNYCEPGHELAHEEGRQGLFRSHNAPSRSNPQV